MSQHWRHKTCSTLDAYVECNSWLSDDAIIQILSFASKATILTAMLVSKQWNCCAKDDYLWEPYCYSLKIDLSPMIKYRIIPNHSAFQQYSYIKRQMFAEKKKEYQKHKLKGTPHAFYQTTRKIAMESIFIPMRIAFRNTTLPKHKRRTKSSIM